MPDRDEKLDKLVRDTTAAWQYYQLKAEETYRQLLNLVADGKKNGIEFDWLTYRAPYHRIDVKRCAPLLKNLGIDPVMKEVLDEAKTKKLIEEHCKHMPLCYIDVKGSVSLHGDPDPAKAAAKKAAYTLEDEPQ